MYGQISDSLDRQLRIYGRLDPQLSVAQGEAQLTVWAKRMTADRADDLRIARAVLFPRATTVHLGTQGALILSPILRAFFAVLVIACANVANLMLARAIARQREIGIRLSLGAARSRIVRQLLTESIVLAIPAGASGFLIAQLTVQSSVRLMFATIPAEFAE